MYCKKCGTEITEGVVCPNCGQDNSAPEEYEPVRLEGDVPAQELPDGSLAYAVTGKKKKKKTGLIIGISAAAAVAACGVVGYFGFHDSITRMFMGDAGYAKMLNKSAFGDALNVSGKDGGLSAASAASTAAGSVVKSMRTTAAQTTNGDDAAAAAEPEMPDIAALVMSALKEVPDGKELASSVSLNVQPGSMIVNESMISVADIINSITINTAFAKSAGTGRLTVGASENGSSLGTAEVYTDGSNAVLALPGISEHTVQLPSGGTSDSTADTALDEDELKRILGEISDIWFDSFDSADISFTDKETAALTGGDITVSAEGKCVTVTMSEEQVNAMLTKMTDKLKNDSYLIKYVNECFGIGEDDYRKMFPDEIKAGCVISVRHIYDVHNSVLSSHINVNASGVITDLELITADDSFGAGFKADDGKSPVSVQIAARSTGKTDGNAHISVSAGGTEFGLAAEYSGVKTEKWLGKDALVGKLTVKPADADEFESALFNGVLAPTGNSEDAAKAAAELKQFVLSVESGIDGSAYTGEVSLSLGNFGSAGIKIVTEEKDAALTMPAASDGYENMAEVLSEDIGAWVQKLMEEHPALSGAFTAQTDDDEAPADAQSDDTNVQVIPIYAESYGLSGTWNISAVGDRPVTGTNISMQVIIGVNKMTVMMTDGTDENSYAEEFAITYGLLKNGQYGAYFYAEEAPDENSTPIGYIYTRNEIFAVMVDESASQTTYMMKDGIGLNINIDSDKLSEDVTIDDITGRWQGFDFGGDLYIAAITPDMLMTDIFTAYGLVQLEQEKGGFGVYVYGTPHTEENRIGSLRYSREEDALYMTRTSDGADAALARIDDIIPDYPYLGEWTLSEMNGVAVEELAESSGMTFEEATGNIYVSPYIMITESKKGTDMRLVLTPDDSGFAIDMSPYTGGCVYDAEEDSLTVIMRYDVPDDGSSQIQIEGVENITVVMKYKRGSYDFE